jgi:hypothetical protein
MFPEQSSLQGKLTLNIVLVVGEKHQGHLSAERHKA